MLFASLELGRARWLVTVSAPGSDKLSRHAIAGGDSAALLQLLSRLRATAERRLGAPASIAVVQEAGLDGFWLHRLLLREGIASHVVDPASIAVNRRHLPGQDGRHRRRPSRAHAHGLDARGASGVLHGRGAQP
jgi:transposase